MRAFKHVCLMSCRHSNTPLFERKRMPKPIDTLRLLVFPLSWLYGLIVFVRNKLYDWQILKSQEFEIPVICVGNITVGGTGKTPHVEYLIRQYGQKYNLAVLSRGYGRKTKGFRYVNVADSAQLVGDEPLQMKQKFPELTFAVDEKRVRGIQRLQEKGCNLIVLDDALQHRAVTPQKAIVLLEYSRLPYKDSYLPSGNLREGRYALKRADCVLVTKCPDTLTEQEKQKIIQRNAIKTPCYFTHFAYGAIRSYQEEQLQSELENQTVLLLTGIANPKPLVQYLEEKVAKVHSLCYPDHYDFTEKDLQKIKQQFMQMKAQSKIILTTEKDKVKLLPLLASQPELSNWFYYIPIQVVFEKDTAVAFQQLVGV